MIRVFSLYRHVNLSGLNEIKDILGGEKSRATKLPNVSNYYYYQNLIHQFIFLFVCSFLK